MKTTLSFALSVALLSACGSSSSGGDDPAASSAGGAAGEASTAGGGTSSHGGSGSVGGGGATGGHGGGATAGAGGHPATGAGGNPGTGAGGNPTPGAGGTPATGAGGDLAGGVGGSPAGTGGAGAGGTPMGTGGTGALVTYGQVYDGGQFHLGPVDYAESQFHNACAPGTKYDPKVQQVEGTFLAGLWNGIPDVAGYCDACIWVITGAGKTAMLRVVTYGDTSSNSIDTSPDAYAALDSGEYPRAMTWQLAKCPESGPMMYEFQTGANAYWTSLWVRNARVPVAKVEVKSANHPDFLELARGSDGTLTDASGFGMGPFSLRTTGIDGQTVTEDFDWPSPDIAGAFLTGKSNFP